MATRPTTTTAVNGSGGDEMAAERDWGGGESMKRLTFTVTEVADLLGLSPSSAYKAVKAGEIPSLTFGGRIVVPCQAIDKLLSVEEAS